jgi:hypothetical protein
MSIATIDRATYFTLLYNTTTRYLRKGFSLKEAEQRAQELMDNAFERPNATDRANETDQKESGIYG